jgi:hypothetical protein
MRAVSFACVLLAVAACGKKSTGGDDDQGGADAPGVMPDWTVQSTDLVVPAGGEITKCYYFHTPNTTAMPITRWASHMTPGSHHMIMFWGSSTQPADGTINDDCGLGGGITNVPIWVYAAQTPDQDLQLPTDDGTGKPLAQNVPPNQPAYFQMHYLNATDADLTVHVEIEAYELKTTTTFTQTDAYITYNNNISIPPEAVGTVASGTCTTPTGASFWEMSTHSHKQSVATDVKDSAGNVIFSSTDWEHPGSTLWNAPTFYQFPTNSLTWDCTYNNNDPSDPNSTMTIVAGQSAVTNEMCMATGYFFPSTGAQACLCTAQGCFTAGL